jgi:hypothetical protein
VWTPQLEAQAALYPANWPTIAVINRTCSYDSVALFTNTPPAAPTIAHHVVEYDEVVHPC